MSKPYLEVTYRQGKPFAAYLYLRRRPGDTAATTQRHRDFVVDYSADGRAIGIEFTSLRLVDLSSVNNVLTNAHEEALSAADLAPLSAA
jgi:uncharacterized protein YuzE